MMNNAKILGEIETENYGNVPIMDIHMMSNEEELALSEECKKAHPEFYTPENLAKYRVFMEMPCDVPGLR